MMAAGAAQMQDATIAIRPSKLWIEAGALRVVWEDNDDVIQAIILMRKNEHTLPSLEKVKADLAKFISGAVPAG